MNKLIHCRTFGKTFATTTGQTITSPCCNNIRCPRCSRQIRLRHFFRIPLDDVIIAAQTYCVLPYYSLQTIKLKSKVNRHFIRGLRRLYNELAYVVTYEKQSDLFHANWLILSDQPLDTKVIKQLWVAALEKADCVDGTPEQWYAGPVADLEDVGSYILKTNVKGSAHLPSKEASPRTVTFSRNWRSFLATRMAEQILYEEISTYLGTQNL